MGIMDRIRHLCSKAMSAKQRDVEGILAELRSALREYRQTVLVNAEKSRINNSRSPNYPRQAA
jgi:hypothetical protein